MSFPVNQAGKEDLLHALVSEHDVGYNLYRILLLAHALQSLFDRQIGNSREIKLTISVINIKVLNLDLLTNNGIGHGSLLHNLCYSSVYILFL